MLIQLLRVCDERWNQTKFLGKRWNRHRKAKPLTRRMTTVTNCDILKIDFLNSSWLTSKHGIIFSIHKIPMNCHKCLRKSENRFAHRGQNESFNVFSNIFSKQTNKYNNSLLSTWSSLVKRIPTRNGYKYTYRFHIWAIV